MSVCFEGSANASGSRWVMGVPISVGLHHSFVSFHTMDQKRRKQGGNVEGRKLPSLSTGEWEEQGLAHHWVRWVAFGKTPWAGPTYP